MKRNTFFLKIFIPFFACFLFLGVAFSLYIFRNISSTFKERFYEERKVELTQMRNTLEQQTKMIEGSFAAYGSSSNFLEIVSQPLTAENFRTFYDVKSELSYIGNIANLMKPSEISLVSLKQNWGIVDGNLKQLTKEEVGKYVEGSEKGNVSISWSKNSNDLEMRIGLPVYDNTKSAIGIVKVKEAELKAILGENAKEIAIFRKGQAIYENDSLPSEKLQQLVEKNKDNLRLSETLELGNNNEQYLLTKSPNTNWIYCYRVNLGKELVAINRLQGVFIVGVLLVLGLIGLLFYRYTERFSRPMNSIQEALNITPYNWKDNDLALVEKNIDLIKEKNSNLEAHLNLQRNQLENLYMLSLFNNRLISDEIQFRGRQYGFPVEASCFYTVVIRIANMSFHVSPDRQLFLLAINNILTESLDKKSRFCPIVLGDDLQATIVSDNKEQIKEKYIEIQEKIWKFLKLKIEIGISAPYHDLLSAKNSLTEAKEAVYQRQNSENTINFYEEMLAMHHTEPVKYPIEKQNALFESIRLDSANVKEQLTDIIDAIFSSNHNSASIGIALIRLVNEICQFGQIIGINNDNLHWYKEVYIDTLTHQNPEIIQKLIFEKLLLPIIEANHAQLNAETHSISQEIVNIIHSEYDRDLTLEEIANRLHYNSRYLGRIFKKEVGENFGEYISQYRLKIAQDLLKDSTLTVGEIAEKLCYQNSQNFIRFFKKRVNMTPLEFRQYYHSK